MDVTGSGFGARVGRRIAAAAALAIVLAAPPARATDRLEGFAAVRLGVMHFDYEEREDGVFLDGEKGFVPSLTGELELRRDRLFTRLVLRVAGGTVDYNGQTQSGTPLQTQTDELFLQGEAQVGGFVDPAKRLALFAGVGARRWTRDIQGSGGYTEIYGWGELQGGLRWTFLQQARQSWDLEARVVRTFNAAITIDFTRFGAEPGKPRLPLGSETGWRVGSTFRHDLGTDGLILVAAVWAEGYAFGRSDSIEISFPPPVGLALVHEPDSKTTNVGLELGIGGRF